MEQKKIRKWGNSQGILLSISMLRDVGLQIDDMVNVEVQDGGILLSPVPIPNDIHEDLQEVTDDIAKR